jgi:hypothetical protein
LSISSNGGNPLGTYSYIKGASQKDGSESTTGRVASPQPKIGAGVMKKIGLVLAAILVVLVAIVGKWAHDNLTVELPKYAPVQNPVWLNQN